MKAKKRGTMRNQKGLTDMTSRASICSRMRMVAMVAVMSVPGLAAIMAPTMIGANSRRHIRPE
ncbi:hypothetical protein D3C86_1202810 [compost metagenome]